MKKNLPRSLETPIVSMLGRHFRPWHDIAPTMLFECCPFALLVVITSQIALIVSPVSRQASGLFTGDPHWTTCPFYAGVT